MQVNKQQEFQPKPIWNIPFTRHALGSFIIFSLPTQTVLSVR